MADKLDPTLTEIIDATNEILTNITRPEAYKGDTWKTDIVASSTGGDIDNGASTNRYSPPIDCVVRYAYVELDGEAEEAEEWFIMKNDEEIASITVDPGANRSVVVPINVGYGPTSQLWVRKGTE